MESARTECDERRARRYLRQAAMALVLWGLCTATGVEHSGVVLAQQTDTSVSDRVLLRAAAKAADSGDFASGFVDAFVELRRQQAEVLRLEP
jgi:hypothetical protein